MPCCSQRVRHNGAFVGSAVAPQRPALRFLLLCLGSWAVVRVVANWNPAIPASPPGLPPPPWVKAAMDSRAPLTIATAVAPESKPVGGARPLVGIRTVDRELWQRVIAPPAIEAPVPTAGGQGWSGDGRHGLRMALMARLLPPLPGGTAHTALSAAPHWSPLSAEASTAPGGGQPFWMRRNLANWSLGSWLLWRDDLGRKPNGIAVGGQLGGSQAGARLAYGFGEAGRLRAYARGTLALAEPRQRELAFGLAFAPVSRWPVDVAVEQRIAAGKLGRTALAASLSGGVGDFVLPHGFRLEAYGQAGVVGARRRDAYADAAVVIDRAIGRLPDATIHFGGLAAGSVQPDVARVDVGPRLTLRLPKIGEGSRVALDWRQRVAGRARPDSGVALTLAADF